MGRTVCACVLLQVVRLSQQLQMLERVFGKGVEAALAVATARAEAASETKGLRARGFSFIYLPKIGRLYLQVDRLSQQLHKLERDLDSAKSAEASARAEAASETKRRALQTAEAEAAAANTRSEHSQALSRLQASVKKLEVRTVR